MSDQDPDMLGCRRDELDRIVGPYRHDGVIIDGLTFMETAGVLGTGARQ